MKLFEELEEAQKEIKKSVDNSDLEACIELVKNVLMYVKDVLRNVNPKI